MALLHRLWRHTPSVSTDLSRAIAAAAVAALLVSSGARAGDPISGMALFNNVPDAIISCGNSACHGPNPNDNVNGLQKAGNNAGVIDAAIRVNVPDMMFLNGLLNPFELDDLAAYLAPQPDLSDTSIAFGGQAVGVPSLARSITLRNLGGVDLSVTAIALSGADAANFSVGGSCGGAPTLASATIDRTAASCAIEVAFTPAGSRSYQATVTLTYAGATTLPSRQSIALTGSGSAPAVAAIAIDSPSIDFGDVIAGAVAPSRTLTVSNPGTAALSIAAIDASGVFSGDFGFSGSCLDGIFTRAVEVAPGGSCAIVVSFGPQGPGAREATLTIRHNADGGSTTVALSGFGVSPTCAPPQPAVEFRTLSCPAGESGTITQSRSYSCVGTAWVAGAFATTAANCQAATIQPPQPVQPAPLSLTEYHNSILDHYFITADPDERASIDSGLAGPGWTPTMTLGHVWSPDATGIAGGTPICRFYGNPATGPDGRRIGPNSHFYTADPDECEAVKNDRGWVFEGIVFQAVEAIGGECAAPLVPVRRNYNQRFADNDSNHRYSTDPAIAAQMTSLGWSDEGVVFCIAP